MFTRLLTFAFFVACMLCVSASPARADGVYLVTMTFDDLAAGRRFSHSPRITSIRNDANRSGLGVSVRGEFYVAPLAQTTSQPHAAFGVGPFIGDPAFNSLQVEFTGLQTCYLCPPPPSCLRCTNFVSLNVVGTQPGQMSAWEVYMYSDNGSLLFYTFGLTDQFVTFTSTMSNIASFRFFASPNNEGIDNVSYNAPVPEPATIALLGTGLAVLGAARRRRKSAVGSE
jgi:hypothetical protein